MELEELKTATVYQSFDDFGHDGKSSKSREKFEKLKFDRKGRKILDIGCNSGYLPLQFSKNGADIVIGIDTDENILELAEQWKDKYNINNVFFNHTSIFNPQIWDIIENIDIDTITCSSTFHYFRELQTLFFKICNTILPIGGYIILECGLSQTLDTEYYARSSTEIPCHYPSLRTIVDMANLNGFGLLYLGESVDQPGDKIPRYVLHFIKQDE